MGGRRSGWDDGAAIFGEGNGNGRDWGSGTGTTAAGQAALLRADGGVRRVVRAVVGGGGPVLGGGRGDHVGGGAGDSAGGGDRGQSGQRGGPAAPVTRAGREGGLDAGRAGG